MSSDDINSALENLSAIKAGEDPRQTDSTESQTRTATTASEPASKPDDALAVARNEVERLYERSNKLSEQLPRDMLHVGVARWKGRNGVCKYNKRLDRHRFGARMPKLPRKTSHHAIVINEKILEQGNRDQFIDTLRHEVAHALAHAIYGEYPSRQKHRHYDPQFAPHGPVWKSLAVELGADPSACHNKRDRSDEYKYYIGCPNCGMRSGKTKRSKTIKKPFNRKCAKCGESELVSFDAGDEMPDENGTVAVESIPWDNQTEYWSHQ